MAKPAALTFRQTFGLALTLAAIVVVLDQLSKWVVVATMNFGARIDVLPFFSWVHARNYGAAWSMLNDAGGWQRWFFLVVGVVFCAIVVTELRRLPAIATLPRVAFGLLLGGAVGNMIDRALYGYVVDFVFFYHGSWSFPAFNVADSAITIGAALFIWTLLQDWRRERASGAA